MHSHGAVHGVASHGWFMARPPHPLSTPDPPGVAPRGSIEGDELYTVVDFGPGEAVQHAVRFQAARSMGHDARQPRCKGLRKRGSKGLTCRPPTRHPLPGRLVRPLLCV